MGTDIYLENEELGIHDLITKLEYAKESVNYILNHNDGSVDCHGITYWAGEVERLRQEIQDLL